MTKLLSLQQHAVPDHQQRRGGGGDSRWCSASHAAVFLLGLTGGVVFSQCVATSKVLPFHSCGGESSLAAVSSSLRGRAAGKEDGEKDGAGGRKSFEELLVESKSDKYDRHHFEQYYSRWLEPYRTKSDAKLLELGAAGGRSLELWNNFLEGAGARILGLAYGRYTEDLDTKVSSELPKVGVVYGDQSEERTMDQLRARGPWDVIIDDASHVPEHVVFSLYSLWDSVKPGGMYVIEDLETSYWPSGTHYHEYVLEGTGIGADPRHSVASKLEQIQQVLVRHQIGATDLTVMPGDHDICSVEWGMNVVAIRKCEDGVAKPPYQEPVYDARRMSDWIEEARKSNPF